MQSANKKEHRVSFQTSPSTRSRRQQTGDPGYDGYGTDPTPQDYYILEKAHNKLKEELAVIKSELEGARAAMAGLKNSVEVLTADKKTLTYEKRNLQDEVHALREEIRSPRSSPPREQVKMSGALPPEPSSSKDSKLRRSESKHRRSESKVRRTSEEKQRAKEQKEYDKRMKEDKERLGRRFDPKDDRSVVTNSSSGRSKTESYIEPYGPATPRPAPPVVESVPRRSRRDSTYSSSTVRPAVYTHLTEPVYADIPHTDYDMSAGYIANDGHYYLYPLDAHGRPIRHS
ncbi:hypothetical protein CCHL11_01385 [Colletotrichum chlorophyti]|uniref:Uncharacterized protein n=1 Tax=Colletotrichum chlorophyti TaxID=708187 RepID=A0A1Q8RYN0_9PEZI|nr:hypothetical protein CCHL11_01385 [Colletotrichum chlorophyti]